MIPAIQPQPQPGQSVAPNLRSALEELRFKRLESTVHLQRIGVGRLEELESKERLENAIRDGTTILDSDTKTVMDREKVQALLETRKSIVEIARTMEKSLGTKAVRWYTVRYYLLVAGFVLLIAARVWKGYQ